MRVAAFVAMALAVGPACAPEVSLGVNLQHANARVPFQTAPASVLVFTSDIDDRYDVLGDVEVTLAQRSAFGDVPTRDQVVLALKEQAGRIGAHAIIHLSFGDKGMSLWSYNELRGHGRAVRFR